MSQLLYLNVGENAAQFFSSASNTSADPQIQFFENFDRRAGAFGGILNNTLSVGAVNIPLSISFDTLAAVISIGANNATRSVSGTILFGLYSLNGSTLSLANSASVSRSFAGAATSTLWVTFGTSATQNISPGAWYFAQAVSTVTGGNTGGGFGIWRNAAPNILNNPPGFVIGTFSATTDAMPASMATSDFASAGAVGHRQPYMIISA